MGEADDAVAEEARADRTPMVAAGPAFAGTPPLVLTTYDLDVG